MAAQTTTQLIIVLTQRLNFLQQDWAELIKRYSRLPHADRRDMRLPHGLLRFQLAAILEHLTSITGGITGETTFNLGLLESQDIRLQHAEVCPVSRKHYHDLIEAERFLALRKSNVANTPLVQIEELLYNARHAFDAVSRAYKQVFASYSGNGAGGGNPFILNGWDMACKTAQQGGDIAGTIAQILAGNVSKVSTRPRKQTRSWFPYDVAVPSPPPFRSALPPVAANDDGYYSHQQRPKVNPFGFERSAFPIRPPEMPSVWNPELGIHMFPDRSAEIRAFINRGPSSTWSGATGTRSSAQQPSPPPAPKRFRDYDEAWRKLGPQDSPVPFPSSTLRAQELRLRSSLPSTAVSTSGWTEEQIVRANVALFILRGFGITWYVADRKVRIDNDQLLGPLSKQLRIQEKQRWHVDRLALRGNGIDREAAHWVWLEVVELCDECDKHLGRDRAEWKGE